VEVFIGVLVERLRLQLPRMVNYPEYFYLTIGPACHLRPPVPWPLIPREISTLHRLRTLLHNNLPLQVFDSLR
jgi:hypothetical protein